MTSPTTRITISARDNFTALLLRMTACGHQSFAPPNIKLTCPAAIPIRDNDKQGSSKKQFTWPGQVQRPVRRTRCEPRVSRSVLRQHRVSLRAATSPSHLTGEPAAHLALSVDRRDVAAGRSRSAAQRRSRLEVRSV